MELDNNTIEIDWNSYGVLVKIADGIATIEGLNDVLAGERVIIGDGVEALVLNIENRYSKAVIFGNERDIQQNDLVQRTNSIMSVPTGLNILGYRSYCNSPRNITTFRRRFSTQSKSVDELNSSGKKYVSSYDYNLTRGKQASELFATAAGVLSLDLTMDVSKFGFKLAARPVRETLIDGLFVSRRIWKQLEDSLNFELDYTDALYSGFLEGSAISVQIRQVESIQDLRNIDSEGRNDFQAEMLFALVTQPTILTEIKNRVLSRKWQRIPLFLSKEEWAIVVNFFQEPRSMLDPQTEHSVFFSRCWSLMLFSFLGNNPELSSQNLPYSEVEYSIIRSFKRHGDSAILYDLALHNLNNPLELFNGLNPRNQ